MIPVPIGRGMYRLDVRSKRLREKLASTPGIIVQGARVIFPERLYDAVTRYLVTGATRRKRVGKPEQMTLI